MILLVSFMPVELLLEYNQWILAISVFVIIVFLILKYYRKDYLISNELISIAYPYNKKNNLVIKFSEIKCASIYHKDLRIFGGSTTIKIDLVGDKKIRHLEFLDKPDHSVKIKILKIFLNNGVRINITGDKDRLEKRMDDFNLAI